MSEPVSNVEIEDVLSSIRRLVTESGGKPAEKNGAQEEKALLLDGGAGAQNAEPEDENAEGSQEQPAAIDTGFEKLVLTPSLRVVENAPHTDEEFPDVPEEPVKADSQDVAGSLDVHELEYSADDATDEANEDGVPEDGAPEVTFVDKAGTVDDGLKGRIERLETAVGQQDDDWEESEEDAASQGFETLQWEDHQADPEADAAQFVAPQAETAYETDQIDQVETPDASGAFDFLGDDSVIDEEMLREMVSDIVRQELQGALGERITRNVRKLVRREIHRALMAQELE